MPRQPIFILRISEWLENIYVIEKDVVLPYLRICQPFRPPSVARIGGCQRRKIIAQNTNFVQLFKSVLPVA